MCRRPTFVVMLVLSFFGCAAARAQTQPDDHLFISGQVNFVESGKKGGGGGGVEWLHPLTSYAALNVGAFTFAFDRARWGYGKLGGHFTYQDKTTLSADIKIGGGQENKKGFPYQIYRAAITQSLVDDTLYFVAENQYFRVGEIRENLVKTGVILFPFEPLRLQVNFHFSTGGNVVSRFGSARIDLRTSFLDYLAGAAFGRTTPDQFDTFTGKKETINSLNLFAGVSIPLGRQKVTFVVDGVRQEALWKSRMQVIWKIPF